VQQWAIWDALDGNPAILIRILRTGLASPEHQALAASLIEGTVKPRRPKKGKPTRRIKDLIAQSFFQLKAQHRDWSEKQIKGKLIEAFGVKKTHVYKILKELDPERRKLYRQNGAAVAAFKHPDPSVWEKFVRKSERKIPRK
jgi:hypothetical protein